MPNAQTPEPPPDPQTLPRVLNAFDAITLVIGSIIGSGVFLKAAVISEGFYKLGLTPSFGPIIAVWIIVGLVTLCGSLALGELAAMLPHAGGPYVYLREAYGRLPAFLWGWTEFWIIRTGSLGSLACATVIYLDKFLVLTFTGNSWFDPFLPLDAWAQGGISIFLVLVLTVVNVIGTRWAAWVQNITTVIKVGFICLLIVAPLVMRQASTANLAPFWPDDLSLNFWRVIGLAMVAVMWPYDGWINIGPVAEEIKNPQRNVPLALAVGMFVVIAVYVGANCSYHLVLPMRQVADSSGVAAEVFQVLFGTLGGQLAAVGVMCSTFGAINSNLLAGPRIYFAMARDKLLPGFLCQVHGGFQTPANAIVIQTVWTIVLIVAAYAGTGPLERLKSRLKAPFEKAAESVPADTVSTEVDATPVAATPFEPRDAFDALTDFVIFGGSIFYSMAVGAVFVLRFKRPDLPRPYKTWGYPLAPALYLVAFFAVLVSLLFEKWVESSVGIGLIAAGAVYYFVVTRRSQAESPPAEAP